MHGLSALSSVLSFKKFNDPQRNKFPPKKIYRCEPRAVNVCTCEDSGWAGCPHKHTYMLTHTSQTDPRKLALCKYRLRFRFAVSEREREREKQDGWKVEEERVAVREAGEGGVIFVVGATKGGTESWRV